MEAFDNIAVFIAVYEQGSLSAAARQLNRSLQAVSRALIGLEQELGVTLIRRTTRRCTPTEAGMSFYQRVKPAHAELLEAKLEAANRRAEPTGLLRIGAAIQFGPAYLVPIVADFMKRYPQVDVELSLSDSFVDLVEGNLDLALRIGRLPDSELRARPLGALRRVVYGSPSYFEAHGRPQRPEELRQHHCVLRSAVSRDAKWPFTIDGREREIAVTGRFRANHTAAVVRAATEGLGGGFAPYWQVRELVEAGRLEVVLVPFEAPPVPIHAVWPGSRLTTAATRHFLDFLLTRLREQLPEH